MIEYKATIETFDQLLDLVWSGAVDTLHLIAEYGKEEELMKHLQYSSTIKQLTLTDINDSLWHDSETVLKAVGIDTTTGGTK